MQSACRGRRSARGLVRFAAGNRTKAGAYLAPSATPVIGRAFMASLQVASVLPVACAFDCRCMQGGLPPPDIGSLHMTCSCTHAQPGLGSPGPMQYTTCEREAAAAKG